MEEIEGNIVDIHTCQIYPGTIFVSDGKIRKIKKNQNTYSTYLVPGFIDSHVHIESSMLTPVHFADLIVSKGTVAIVNDPHEIANVMGVAGIHFMMNNSQYAKVKCFFGIPSCVPATPFDSAGGIISVADTEKLAATGKFVCLSEMMNLPGVLNADPEVIQKLQIAKKYSLKVDGHAPLLSGTDLIKYVEAGISTDHESSDLNEAKEKISAGMKIMIREGSAAKNYNALKSLIETHPESLMFCTDDAHPDEIIQNGHIDKMVRLSIENGYDLFSVLRIASLNPIQHYNLPVGTLKVGDYADFIRIDNLKSFEVLETYIDGKLMYKKGILNENPRQNEELIPEINNFSRNRIEEKMLQKKLPESPLCIGLINQEIITSKSFFHVNNTDYFESDVDQDILKLVYLNRYSQREPQVAWIKGVGLKNGAFASSIAHDSHNILAVGCNDRDISTVINRLIDKKGALVVVNSSGLRELELPIGGIMSDKIAQEVADKYELLTNELKKAGCRLDSPFMTLAFMSLIVIPELKIGEKGLFDFKTFQFIEER